MVDGATMKAPVALKCGVLLQGTLLVGVVGSVSAFAAITALATDRNTASDRG